MWRLTLLGTGTSNGVPVIGCDCPVCRSSDPRDRRMRTSALLEADGLRLLIDCGPDLRQQMLPHPFAPIDGVLLTHEHYDHTGGLDDLRPFCKFGHIPLYGEERVLERVRTNLPYCFDNGDKPRVPHFLTIPVSPGHPVSIKARPIGTDFSAELFDSANATTTFQPPRTASLEVLPLRVHHGTLPILGYRIGPLGYITDCKTVPAETMQQLQGITTLVIGGLRLEPHSTHLSVAEAVAVAEQLQARQVRLVHMAHSAGLHAGSTNILPPHISYGYDGEQLQID